MGLLQYHEEMPQHGIHYSSLLLSHVITFCEDGIGLSCILVFPHLYGAVTRPTIQCTVGFKVGNLRAVKLVILQECCGYEVYYNIKHIYIYIYTYTHT
jgi:hypothetical protein